MAKSLSVSEAAAIYGTAVADLHHPIILQQEGQPLAVIVTFDEYQHWRALAADEAERRLAGWRSLELLLAEVHRRPSDYTGEQIEAEISAAWTERRPVCAPKRSPRWQAIG